MHLTPAIVQQQKATEKDTIYKVKYNRKLIFFESTEKIWIRKDEASATSLTMSEPINLVVNSLI